MSFAEDIALRTVWGEARGEGEAGMVAVAHVLVNRLRSGRWGDTLTKVCLWPVQFSCWNTTDPNREQIAALADADPLLLQIADYVADALTGTPDPTNGSTHYYAAGTPVPNWSFHGRFQVQIGKHRFYSGVA